MPRGLSFQPSCRELQRGHLQVHRTRGPDSWFYLLLCSSPLVFAVVSTPPWGDELPTVLIRYPSTLIWDGVLGCSCPRNSSVKELFTVTLFPERPPPVCVHHRDPLGSEELDIVSPFQRDVLFHHACHVHLQ